MLWLTILGRLLFLPNSRARESDQFQILKGAHVNETPLMRTSAGPMDAALNMPLTCHPTCLIGSVA